jgi:predicted metalloprotease
MRWRDYGQSSNIEDRRGMGGRGLAIGGGGIGVLILLVAALVCGVDPRQLLENLPQDTTSQQPGAASNSTNKTAG